MDLQPMGDRVIVRRIPEETMTRGGVLLPDIAQERSLRGEVLAAGPGTRTAPCPVCGHGGGIAELPVKAGDVVHFTKYSGFDVDENGEELLILREDHLIAVETT